MIMMWRDEMSDDSKISESRWPTKNDSDGSLVARDSEIRLSRATLRGLHPTRVMCPKASGAPLRDDDPPRKKGHSESTSCSGCAVVAVCTIRLSSVLDKLWPAVLLTTKLHTCETLNTASLLLPLTTS